VERGARASRLANARGSEYGFENFVGAGCECELTRRLRLLRTWLYPQPRTALLFVGFARDPFLDGGAFAFVLGDGGEVVRGFENVSLVSGVGESGVPWLREVKGK